MLLNVILLWHSDWFVFPKPQAWALHQLEAGFGWEEKWSTYLLGSGFFVGYMQLQYDCRKH